PPKNARSTRATWRPLFASRRARGTPAWPLPMISTSTVIARAGVATMTGNVVHDGPDPTVAPRSTFRAGDFVADPSPERDAEIPRHQRLTCAVACGDPDTLCISPSRTEGYEMTLFGMSKEDKRHDVEVLNRSLFFENQGVWAYDFAATKLSQTNVGKAVLALALENQADHKKHQELLISAIQDLGGTPVQAEKQYDLSDY